MRCKSVGVVRMPPAESQTIFDYVAYRPCDTFFVNVTRDVVVGAKDIEVASIDGADEELHGLLGSPGGGRLLGGSDHAGVYKAEDHQMRRDAGIFSVAKLVGKRLGDPQPKNSLANSFEHVYRLAKQFTWGIPENACRPHKSLSLTACRNRT